MVSRPDSVISLRPGLKAGFWRKLLFLGAVCAGLLPGPDVRADSGDEFVIAKWDVEECLPQHTVKVILQTRDGYLWLGTYNGLARFDGLHFTTFNTANTPALHSEDITSLCEDTTGRLWIGTDHGLFKRERGQFVPCPEAEALRDAHVTKIVELPDASLCVATDQGIFRRQGSAFQEIPVPRAAWPTRHSLLSVDPTGALWASHRSELYALKDGQLVWQAKLPEEIQSIFVDGTGTHWCGIGNGSLFRARPGSAADFRKIEDVKTESFCETRNKDLWMATSQGALRYRQGKLLRVTSREGLPSDLIKAVFEDREGNIWLGTAGSGLVRLREKLLKTHTTRNGMSSDDAVAVLEDKQGRTWVGTFEGGLNRFENGQWHPHTPVGLPPEVRSVISLCQTRDGALWFGCYGQGAFRWPEGGQVEPIVRTKETVIRVIFEDREGGLWFGSNKFGVEYRHGETVRQYNTENGLSLNFITAIAQDASGHVWIGTEYGLNRIDDGKITRFFKPDGLGANLINVLVADQAGALWIGTTGGGLSRYKEGRFATITTAQGLTQDVVTQIVEDDDGNLWMGSRMGIFRAAKENVNAALDGRSSHVYCASYTKADGLLDLSCVGGFQPSSMKARDGRLWFCGPGGVTVIDPKRITGNPLPPPVYIETVVADGENVFSPGRDLSPSSPAEERSGSGRSGPSAGIEVTPSQPVRIQAGARRLEFRFTGLNFSQPEQLQFLCMLEGYDESWQFVGTRRAAYYTRVPPGHYRFRVAAATGEAGDNQPEAAVSLVVLPHFRETWWFRALSVSLAALILILFLRLKIRGLREVEELRWRIASDLHDEVGSNLSNIALLSHLGESGAQSSNRLSAEFAEINRVALDTAHAVRDLVWFISPECDTLEELVRQMEAVASRSRIPASVDFESKLETPGRRLSLPFRRHLFFLYKEAFHNALKHAQARRVQIEVREEKGSLHFSLRDDGVGYDVSAIRRGHGLSSMRRRADELGGTLRMESRPGAGTQIRLQARLA